MFGDLAEEVALRCYCEAAHAVNDTVMTCQACAMIETGENVVWSLPLLLCHVLCYAKSRVPSV